MPLCVHPRHLHHLKFHSDHHLLHHHLVFVSPFLVGVQVYFAFHGFLLPAKTTGKLLNSLHLLIEILNDWCTVDIRKARPNISSVGPSKHCISI